MIKITKILLGLGFIFFRTSTYNSKHILQQLINHLRQEEDPRHPDLISHPHTPTWLTTTAGMFDGTVKVWDLRSATAAVASLAFPPPLSTPTSSRPANRPPLPPISPMTPLIGKPLINTPCSAVKSHGKGSGGKSVGGGGGGSSCSPAALSGAAGAGDRPVHSFSARSSLRNYGIHQLALSPTGKQTRHIKPTL